MQPWLSSHFNVKLIGDSASDLGDENDLNHDHKLIMIGETNFKSLLIILILMIIMMIVKIIKMSISKIKNFTITLIMIMMIMIIMKITFDLEHLED